MIKFFNNRGIMLAASLLLMTACRTFYQHGQNDARYDIEHDRLKLCRYGSPIRFEAEIEQIFLIKYNVAWIHFSKEDLTKEVAEHCDGYTKVMETEIRKRFGDNIFSDVSKAAEELHAHRNKPVPDVPD